MAHFETLSVEQQQAIFSLCQTDSMAEAAKRSHIGRTTLYRWMQQPDFVAAYREARYTIMQDALAYLQKASLRAAKVLVGIMENPEAADALRRQTACDILDMAMKVRSVDEVEDRLSALEEPDASGDAEAA